MKRDLFLGTVVLSFVGAFGVAWAVLLNVNVALPQVAFSNTGATAMQYNQASQTFSVVATPSGVQFSPTEGSLTVSPPRSMSIRVRVDHTGALVGGVDGPDLVVSGTVRRVVGTVTNTYSGLLLTGEIQPNGFGFLDADGSVDNFDFRFTPTGGSLLPFFQCDHLAVAVSSAGSTFMGSFATDFQGQAKGSVGLEDLIPPAVTCPDNITVECNARSGGSGGAWVSFPNPVGTDNCDTNLTFVYSPPSGSFFPLDAATTSTNYVVNLTVTDASGNQSVCPFTVTVQDTMAPEFDDNSSPVMGECQENPFILTNDLGQCYATFTFTKPTAVNLCCPAVHTVTVSGLDEYGAVIEIVDHGDGTVTGQFPVTCHGTNILTVVAADDHGNTAQHQCGVIVVDNDAPLITCPDKQIVGCSGEPVVFHEPTVADNCPNMTTSCTPTNGSVLGIGEHSILFTAVDCSGNTNQCTFDVIVQDATPPAISCPPDAVVECGQSTDLDSTGMAAASDNCDPHVAVSYTDAATPVNCTGRPGIARTWRAVDASGNAVTCVQHITFVDSAAPIVVVPTGGDLGYNPPTLPTDVSVRALVTAVDHCSTPLVSVTHVDANNGCAITRTFTVIATDGCGNASAPQTVVYTWTADTTAPTVTVPAGGNLGCNPATLPTDASVMALVTATDACSAPTIHVTHEDSGTACAMSRTFAVTATDGGGNISVPQTVVYAWTADTTPPIITCPAAITVSSLPAPDPGSVTASDDCGGTVTKTFVGDTVATNGCQIVVTRTYRATDACGNGATCTQTITLGSLVSPTDCILWHAPLANSPANDDTDPSRINGQVSGTQYRYSFKAGSTIPIQIRVNGCAGNDVTTNPNVLAVVNVYADQNCDTLPDGNALLIDNNGVGGAGGVMDNVNGFKKYNLDTSTLITPGCYVLEVVVTDVSAGQSCKEKVLLYRK
jgi:hypothetical protein